MDQFGISLMTNELRTGHADRLLRLYPSAHLSKGILVVPLKLNRKLSAKTFTDEWHTYGHIKNKLWRYKPNFAQGIVRAIARIPDELLEVACLVRLDAKELSSSTFCQVVTSISGKPLWPYRRITRGYQRGTEHDSAAAFSGDALCVLRYEYSYTSPGGTVELMAAAVELTQGRAVVSFDRLYHAESDDLSRGVLHELPDTLKPWHKANSALCERRQCTSSMCDGHYYRNRHT